MHTILTMQSIAYEGVSPAPKAIVNQINRATMAKVVGFDLRTMPKLTEGDKIQAINALLRALANQTP